MPSGLITAVEDPSTGNVFISGDNLNNGFQINQSASILGAVLQVTPIPGSHTAINGIASNSAFANFVLAGDGSMSPPLPPVNSLFISDGNGSNTILLGNLGPTAGFALPGDIEIDTGSGTDKVQLTNIATTAGSILFNGTHGAGTGHDSVSMMNVSVALGANGTFGNSGHNVLTAQNLTAASGSIDGGSTPGSVYIGEGGNNGYEVFDFITNTATKVTASPNPSIDGQLVTFTATVAVVSPSVGIPLGSVQFQVDGSNLGAAVVLSNGTATSFSITLAAGPHSVQASYTSSNANFIDSVSGNFTQTVLSYADATTNLYNQVNAVIPPTGIATGGIQNDLLKKLQDAITAFNVPDNATGVKKLNLFIMQVTVLSGTQIDPTLAAFWIAEAQEIITATGL
ncbi:MAG TPA: Ig-like domain-containing protein [Gemmataceae bacterium]|nr:Ig-like domain-containing protein [Gemmataceae bacterium]